MKTITQLKKGIASSENKFKYCVEVWNELCKDCGIDYESLIIKNGKYTDGDGFFPEKIADIIKKCRYFYELTKEDGHSMNPLTWKGGCCNDDYNAAIREQKYLKKFIDFFSPYSEEKAIKTGVKKTVKVKLKKSTSNGDSGSTEKEIQSKDLIKHIMFNKDNNTWMVTFADGKVSNVTNILKFISLPDIEIPSYYSEFVKKITEIIKKRDTEILLNFDKKYAKKWKDLTDEQQEAVYDFLERKQEEGEYQDISFLEDSDCVFYDGNGDLLGFNRTYAKEVTKQEVIDKFNSEILDVSTSENDIISYSNSIKPEEEREISFYLVQNKRKFFLVEKKHIKKFEKAGAKIIEKLSNDWEAEIIARNRRLEEKNNIKRYNKSVEYELVNFGLFDEKGNAITTSKPRAVSIKKDGKDDKLLVYPRIRVTTGKISHHKSSERKSIDNKPLNPEILARELSDLLLQLDVQYEQVAERYKELDKIVKETMEAKRFELNKIIAPMTNATKIEFQKPVFNKNIPKFKVKKLKNIPDVSEELTDEMIDDMVPPAKEPTQGFYSVITDEENMFEVCDKNELKTIIEEAINIQNNSRLDFERAFLFAINKNNGQVQQTLPTFFYQLPVPKPYIPKYYQTEVLYGCYYAAIKFFLYVSNTPLDEDYEYERVVPEHEILAHKRVKIVDGYTSSGIPILRSESDIRADAEETKIVPEHTVMVKHKADDHYVRGDWVMTFRGRSFKAFATDPDTAQSAISYDIVMDQNWFELDNREILTIEDANARSDKIELIAQCLYENTKDYIPPTDEGGVPVYGRDTFNCPCTNINPRFVQLEKGRYKKSTGYRAEGPKYPHGLINHYSYQAPKGFIEVTNQYLLQFTMNAKGYSKQASVLINRFSSKFNTKWGERYFDEFISGSNFDIQKPGKQYRANNKFTKDTTEEIKLK